MTTYYGGPTPAGEDTRTPYDQAGGAPVISRMVDLLYGWISFDEQLWLRYFANVTLSTLKHHMAAFLTMALGGPGRYEGRDMRSAHEGLGPEDGGVRPEDFERVANYVHAALLVCQVPEPIRAAALAKVGSLADQVILNGAATRR